MPRSHLLLPFPLAQALVTAVPRVFNVFVVILIFVVIFGIIGVQSFQGVMQICTDPSIPNIGNCTGTFQLTGESCAFLPTDAAEAVCRLNQTGSAFPRLWTTYQNPNVSPESFNNIARSMLVVFELMTGGVSSMMGGREGRLACVVKKHRPSLVPAVPSAVVARYHVLCR